MYADWNLEDRLQEYFIGENPKFLTALDIGANDGVTLSNTRQIILDGWNAVLVDPAESAYKRLKALYHNHSNVLLCNVAIGDETKKKHSLKAEVIRNGLKMLLYFQARLNQKFSVFLMLLLKRKKLKL